MTDKNCSHRKRHVSRNRILAGLASVAMLAGPQLTLGAGSADVMMEEVMVYGTKKGGAEAVQDIPAQVAAYGSDQLAALQVVNIEDLSFHTPNVQLDQIGTQVSFAAFSIRGLGIDNSTPTIDPNVGTFIDGVYAGVPFGVVTDTFDLESVEIYKGPQALLFGRNVTGGAVLLRSKRPTGEFGLDVTARVEEEEYLVAAAVEGALVEDVLFGRIAVQYKDDDGWYENDYLGRNVGEQESEFVRGSLVWNVSDSTALTFIVEDGSTEGHAVPVNNVFDPAKGTYNFENTITPQNDSFDVEQDFSGTTDLNWTQVTFEASIDLGDMGVITNIMGYREVDSLTETDVDGVNPDVTPSLDGRSLLNIIGVYKIDQDQFSNELRYNYERGDKWSLTAGLVYFTQESEYGTGLWRGGDTGIDHGSNVFGGGTQDHDSWSFYINGDYAVTDTFSLNGGFNYLVEDKEVMIVPRATSSIVDGGPCDMHAYSCDFSGQGVPAEDDWSLFSPKLGFTWETFFEDGHFYGHIARAYRSGFFNVRQTNPDAINLNPTEEEEHTQYELGFKSTIADGRVRFNGAIFLQEIDNLARSAGGEVLVNGDPSPVQDLLNVGDAEISGVEMDVIARITDNLLITAGFGYLDGDITNATANINKSRDEDGNLEVGGDAIDESLDIVRLSPWSTHVGIVYDLNIGNAGIMTFRADHNYRDGSAARDDNWMFFPSTTMVNAGVSYAPMDGNWRVSLYGKNLTDEVVYRTVFTISNQVFAPISKGRRYSLEFTYSI